MRERMFIEEVSRRNGNNSLPARFAPE